MQVIVDNLMTSYSSEGKGPVVLMLHGWGDSKETFDSLAKELASTYCVVRVDLPGFGGTEAPPIAWGLDDYSSWVEDFVSKLKVESIYAVVGHSNGGAIAIKSLSQGYIDSKKLVLLASAGIRSKDSTKKIVNKAIAKIGKVSTVWLPKNIRQKLRSKMYKTMGSDILVAPHLEESFKKVVSEDILEQAKKITVPTLIIYGDEDTYTPPAFGKLFRDNILGSKFIILPKVGHFVQQDAEESVNQAVKDFM